MIEYWWEILARVAWEISEREYRHRRSREVWQNECDVIARYVRLVHSWEGALPEVVLKPGGFMESVWVGIRENFEPRPDISMHLTEFPLALLTEAKFHQFLVKLEVLGGSDRWAYCMTRDGLRKDRGLRQLP